MNDIKMMTDEELKCSIELYQNELKRRINKKYKPPFIDVGEIRLTLASEVHKTDGTVWKNEPQTKILSIADKDIIAEIIEQKGYGYKDAVEKILNAFKADLNYTFQSQDEIFKLDIEKKARIHHIIYLMETIPHFSNEDVDLLKKLMEPFLNNR